jgi:hypothetical protein
MGDRYARSDINEISIGLSIWDMGYRIETLYIDMVIRHIDMVILDIDMGYGLMMTVWTWSSSISTWDILSLCRQALPAALVRNGGGSVRSLMPMAYPAIASAAPVVCNTVR